MLYLTRADVESLGITMPQIIEAVEEGFRRKGLGQTQMPPKTAVHPREGKTFLHAMPAYVAGVDVACIKCVGGADDNYNLGLPTISGLLLMNDPDTLLPICVMDCTWVTAMRTAAANAVAMKYLGPVQVREVAVVGCGVQGRTNLTAMQVLYPHIERVRAYDIKPEILSAYVKDMSEATGLFVEAVAGPQAAVEGADVIVTAGPSPRDPEPFIEDAWLKPGAMAAPVDYNGSWKSEVYANMDKIITDDHAQTEYYRSKGYFKNVPQTYADLGEIVAGLKPGREAPEERTMSILQGIAVDDAVTARLVYDAARNRGVGIELQL